ncbi:trypsin-like serine protease [Sorangium sp. So ce1036]|uniref:trypsin-like serine protease n=1 Tax=Sorangium sp. So ce1036 TaxID=3133328 RepID=UPI003EFC12B2
MQNRARLVSGVAALLAMTAVPAMAITDGEEDGDGHPHVGLMVAQDADGTPLWRCSGTLLSPTVFLTAGHCTAPPAAHVEIWFDADVQSGIPGNGYPLSGDASGTPHTHPSYDPAAFYLYDLGVVVLTEPMVMEEYGMLPTLDQLDSLKTRRGHQDVTFTAVGYGLQKSFPDAASWKNEADLVRYESEPRLIQINGGLVGDFSLLLSNNAHTGGTCFGDSGGPNFLGSGPDETNVIAGVTSFALNGNCSGTGGVYRIDREDDLRWLAGFLDR